MCQKNMNPAPPSPSGINITGVAFLFLCCELGHLTNANTQRGYHVQWKVETPIFDMSFDATPPIQNRTDIPNPLLNQYMTTYISKGQFQNSVGVSPTHQP